MAYILGPKEGHATLNDTPGNDVIYAQGADNVINSLGGDDTIIAGDGGATVDAGMPTEGFDRKVAIHLFGQFSNVTGGDGDFTITAQGGSQTILLGYGNDKLTLDGGGDTVTIGFGDNLITATGGRTSVIVGNYLDAYPGVSPSGPAIPDASIPLGDTIAFSGAGNSYDNQALNTNPMQTPYSILAHITGGTGDGFFNMVGGGSITTGGQNNTVIAQDGTFFIDAGSGGDTVELGGVIGFDSASVKLEGSGNLVEGYANNGAIYGGSGHNTVDVQSYTTQDDFHVRLGGSDNTFICDGGNSTVDMGGSGAAVVVGTAASGFVPIITATVHGSGDLITFGGFEPYGAIDDQSTGLLVDITTAATVTLNDFGFDRGGIVKVDLSADPAGGAPYASAADVFAQVKNAPGGAVLNLDDGGQIVFTGLTTSQLSVKNFAV